MPKRIPKLKVGDIVRYGRDVLLEYWFIRLYQRGPFIVYKQKPGSTYLYITDIDGVVLTHPDDGYEWFHDPKYLIKDHFLTAAYRAKHGKAKAKTGR